MSVLYANPDAQEPRLHEVQTSRFLWSFRDRVSVETLEQLLNTHLNANQHETCALLREFVRHEHLLRALRFLPDILRLQRLLVRRFNNSIDSAEANGTSVAKFLQGIENEAKTQERKQLIASFQQAWQLCASSLSKFGKFHEWKPRTYLKNEFIMPELI